MATAGLAVRMLSGNTTPSARAAYRVAPYAKTAVPTARQLHVMNRLGSGFSVAVVPADDRRAGARWRGSSASSTTRRCRRAPAAPRSRAGSPRLRRPGRESGATTAATCKHLGVRPRPRQLLAAPPHLLHPHRLRVDGRVLEQPPPRRRPRTSRGSPSAPAYDDDDPRSTRSARFEDLLVAATLHPAMLLFLDNWKSVQATTPTRTTAASCSSCTPSGRDAGYTEQMVKDSAKMLSGLDRRATTPGRAYYDAEPAHHRRRAACSASADANGAADDPRPRRGVPPLPRQPPGHRAADLPQARRPVRLRRARRPRSSTGCRGRVTSTRAPTSRRRCARWSAREEFWASAGQKVRTPIDDVRRHAAGCSTCRPSAPTGLQLVRQRAVAGRSSSTLVFQWPRPDGPPDRAGVWASTTRMLNSWRMHWQLGRRLVARRRRRPTASRPSFLPQDEDPLRRVRRPPEPRRARPAVDARLLQAACEGCDVAPGEIDHRASTR